MALPAPRRYSIDGISPTSIGPAVQELGTPGREVEAQVEARMTLETEDQRTRVQVARPRQGGRAVIGPGESKRPLRSTGSMPAALMLRRISSSGARRRPSLVSSSADTASTSSAPTVSATCASFGPYSDQST